MIESRKSVEEGKKGGGKEVEMWIEKNGGGEGKDEDEVIGKDRVKVEKKLSIVKNEVEIDEMKEWRKRNIDEEKIKMGGKEKKNVLRRIEKKLERKWEEKKLGIEKNEERGEDDVKRWKLKIKD